MKKLAFAAIVTILVGMQLVPYGRSHNNPPVRREPSWDRPQTRELARRACFDCHSNQTRWPWYASIAPVSWLTQSDVNEGRSKLNFSEWDTGRGEAAEAVEVIRGGEIPPKLYVLAHGEAKLSPAEREALIAGLLATLKAGP